MRRRMCSQFQTWFCRETEEKAAEGVVLRGAGGWPAALHPQELSAADSCLVGHEGTSLVKRSVQWEPAVKSDTCLTCKLWSEPLRRPQSGPVHRKGLDTTPGRERRQQERRKRDLYEPLLTSMAQVLPFLKKQRPTKRYAEGAFGPKMIASCDGCLVAHDCGYPLSRYTCRATRVAAAFLDFIAFCRCSSGVAPHPLKILVSHLSPPPRICVK